LKRSVILVGIIALIMYSSLFVFIPSLYTILAGATGLFIAIIFIVTLVFRARAPADGLKKWINVLPLYVFFLIIPFAYAIVFFVRGEFSIPLLIVMASLAFCFFYVYLNIPLAIYHKYQEDKLDRKPINNYPSISIIVPAHNEEKCIAGNIETLLEAYYPSEKEVIIVDDGSTDSTYDIAMSYRDHDVKVVHRPQGGKAAALNTGLQFAQGEIVICVDADSMVSRTSLIEIVRRFDDPDILAVGSNVKILNRNKFLTACQALEYVFDINIPRRALDLFGAVIVVPGCLGAFRRQSLIGSGGWDIETVVEDFDASVKICKSGAFDITNPLAPVNLDSSNYPASDSATKLTKGGGRVVQVNSAAVVYTEAPETLKGLWNQRLRWYGGNFQTLLKHRDALRNPRFGALYHLGFPYLIIDMIFIPLAMLMVIVSAIMSVIAGDVMPLLIVLAVFILSQFVASILAIKLDEEDLKLALYSIFFVIGYKHIIDAVKVKAVFDVLTKRKVSWNQPARIGLFQKKPG